MTNSTPEWSKYIKIPIQPRQTKWWLKVFIAAKGKSATRDTDPFRARRDEKNHRLVL